MSKINEKLINELQQLNGFTENFIESLQDGFIILDTKGRIVISNSAFSKFTGYDKHELLGLSAPFPFWPEEFHNDYMSRFEEMLKDNLKSEFEVVYQRKNEDRIPVTLFVASIKNSKDKTIAYFVLVQDESIDKQSITTKTFPSKELFSVINYRKKYLDLISHKKIATQLDNALAHISDGLVSFDTNWCYTYINDKAGELIGRKPDSLIGKHVWTEFPEAVNSKTYKAFYKAAKTQETQSFEDYFEGFDKWFENRIYPYPQGVTLYFTDISERKKIEKRLVESEKNLDNIINNIGDPIFVKDHKSRLMFVNHAFCEIFNHSKEEIIRSTLEQDVLPSERESFLKIDKEVLKTGIENINVETLTVKGKPTRMISTKKNRFIDDKGNKFIVGVIRDVTKLIQVEKELKSVKNYSESLISSMHEGLVVFDKQTRIISVNPSFCKMSGFSEDELIGQECPYPFSSPETEEASNLRHKQIADGEILEHFESVYIRKDEKRFNVDVMLSHIEDEQGNMLAYFATVIDITKRKISDAKIAKANELLVEANKELNKLRKGLEQENFYLRNELDLVFNYEEMVYGSTEFSNVLTEVEKVAPTNATVLLLGESGTGKELLARAIHNTSSRNNKPLIKVNCSAIPRELIESELFGHKKGSFTGAFSDKVGKFELADGGTLFLDEIGELPLDMQPKILRFLQEGEIEVVGGVGTKTLNVRVIAATNRNLLEEIEKKQFREDLYFRLNVFPIVIPALRDRKDDIPLLVEHFVDKFNKAYEKHIKYISDDAMSKLKAYSWPGNIRELENLIERAAILSTSDTLIIPGFETSNQKAKQAINNKNVSLDFVLRNHILQVLEDCQWKISGHHGASDLLGLKPSTLRDKMKKLGIVKPKLL
ncbi:sigma 54-interacting transcriptional regulator [Lacinutrix iliipiscaria]|uniref:Sigma 54-interacting transcriptional regulator n=1 Tax=Lacinutrix iliipiscaria TaxID=1230532 RepID=A0ABW5WTQ3_9FLAO